MGNLPPLIATKIKTQGEHYKVTYNNVWSFIDDFNKIKENASNFHEFEDVLISEERFRKLSSIMGDKRIIYKEKIIFKKTNY